MKLARREKRRMWDSHSPQMVGVAYDNTREHGDNDHGGRALWEDES